MGIDGNNWTMINSLHENATTAVKWLDQVSPVYINHQGVRQGGILSADMYKVYINGLLDRIELSGLGAYIGNINIAAPTCADDIALLSNDPDDIQKMINISKDFSNMEGYKLQETKSVILRIKTSKKDCDSNFSWTLGNKIMPEIEKTSHMGITRTSANQESNAVNENIQKARRTLYSLMASGLHGENGMDPETALSLLQTYILPVLTYGLEVIVPSKKVLPILETQYRKIIKQILSIPSNTADSAIYMLSGTIPMEGVIHKKMLSLFGNITRLADNSVEKRLATKQLESKSFNSHSWFIVIKKLLILYELPEPELILTSKYEKTEWKRLVDKHVCKYWVDKIVSQSELYSSLNFLSKIHKPGKCHPAIKPYSKSSRDVNRIPVKTKILTGTYILQTNRAKFN